MSTSIRIQSFDDLLEVGLQQPEPQRLLLVLLKAEPEEEAIHHGNGEAIEGGGLLRPVMATDRELTDEVRLDALAEEADQSGLGWDLVMVSSLSAPGDQPPTSEQAEPYLKKMAEDVETGADLSRYAVFDRAGSPVQLQARTQ